MLTPYQHTHTLMLSHSRPALELRPPEKHDHMPDQQVKRHTCRCHRKSIAPQRQLTHNSVLPAYEIACSSKAIKYSHVMWFTQGPGGLRDCEFCVYRWSTYYSSRDRYTTAVNCVTMQTRTYPLPNHQAVVRAVTFNSRKTKNQKKNHHVNVGRLRTVFKKKPDMSTLTSTAKRANAQPMKKE